MELFEKQGHILNLIYKLFIFNTVSTNSTMLNLRKIFILRKEY
jgi:hypothetical protein